MGETRLHFHEVFHGGTRPAGPDTCVLLPRRLTVFSALHGPGLRLVSPCDLQSEWEEIRAMLLHGQSQPKRTAYNIEAQLPCRPRLGRG